ncbi:MAG: hypothetical protein EXR72_20755 [Myxococcales bacterium]|nr:hypothetical protein [Myxococcales bacterium]
MLDPWIIEEIRRREEEERHHREQPVLEIHIETPHYESPRYPQSDRDTRERKQPAEERGVTIVDFSV